MPVAADARRPRGPTAGDRRSAPAPGAFRRLGWAGFWLGFGLGGFFDGILLHQVLQWHHLLSAVAGVGDLRAQVLADGLFHVFTYLVTAFGLWGLWTSRGVLAAPRAGARLAGAGLLGFGVWHTADALLSHWLLGIHRIRMDTENPLLWDLLWLAPFGIATGLTGLWLLRRPGPSGGDGRGGGRTRAGAAAFGLATLVAGGVAALPPAGLPEDRTLAVFRPGLGLPEIAAAAEAAGGRPVWSDASGGVWVIALGPDARPSALYRRGALLVSRGPFAAGCLSWSGLPEPT